MLDEKSSEEDLQMEAEWIQQNFVNHLNRYCKKIKVCRRSKRWWTVSVSNGSGFGPEKRFGSVPEPSKNPTRSVLAGQTRTRNRQPAGFAGFG